MRHIDFSPTEKPVKVLFMVPTDEVYPDRRGEFGLAVSPFTIMTGFLVGYERDTNAPVVSGKETYSSTDDLTVLDGMVVSWSEPAMKMAVCLSRIGTAKDFLSALFDSGFHKLAKAAIGGFGLPDSISEMSSDELAQTAESRAAMAEEHGEMFTSMAEAASQLLSGFEFEEKTTKPGGN